MAGLHHPQIAELLQEVRQRASFPVYQRAEARLATLPWLNVNPAGSSANTLAAVGAGQTVES